MIKSNPVLLIVLLFFYLTAFSNTHININQVLPGISIAEGNGGQRNIEIMILLSFMTKDPVAVSYTTQNGSATAGSDYIAAYGSTSFAPGERMKKITVAVIGDAGCEPNESFEIILRNPSGATLLDSSGKVTIVNDDCMGGNLSVYEVRLIFTGYTTFTGTPADCKIQPNGKVVLTGLISGNEKVSTEDDIVYIGNLHLEIDIDICSSSLIEDPLGGFPHCGMTVLGSGPVTTELEIYYDHRGGYIKNENKTGDFISVVLGSCDQQQIDEEKGMVPNKTIASVFNGRDLFKLTTRTLQVGKYVETENGFETVVEVLRKIR